MSEAELQVQIDQVNGEILTLSNALDEHRRVAKEAIAKLNARRDRLAEALTLRRAGLERLIKPEAIASGEAVGNLGG